MKMVCETCGHVIAVDDNRIPPWCARCGHDIKRPALPPAAGLPTSGKPGGKPDKAKPTVSLIECTQCGFKITVEAGRVPPWCSKCGADVKRPNPPAPPAQEPTDTQPAAEPISTQAASEPMPVEQPLYTERELLSQTVEEIHRDHLEKERRERFSVQNFGVGLLLAAWGFVLGVLPGSGHDPTDKILAAHPQIMQYLNWLQIATCINGLILCLTGYGIRQQKPWAFALASASACLLIFGGVLFFIAFNRIGGGTEIEDGVAKVRIIRENLDMLIGLVEGGALLVFLYRYSSSPKSAAHR